MSYPPLEAEDLTVLSGLLAVDRAKLFQGQEKALLSDGEFQVHWPELDPDYHTRAVDFLQTYTFVSSPLVAAESWLNPTIDGQLLDGLWRNVSVSIQNDSDGTPHPVLTLRLGYATWLWDTEARIIADQELQGMEELLHVQWRNLDPNDAHALREALTARDFSAASSDPTAGAKAGIGALVIRNDTFGSDWEQATTNLSWEDDGSAVIDLWLVKTEGSDVEFTIGLSCSEEMTLYYGYSIPLAELHTWKQSKGIHTREALKKKDFRILRRDDQKGTFDVVGSVTQLIERELSEFIAEISAGGVVYQESHYDAPSIATAALTTGEIVTISGRKNSQCGIDYTETRNIPSDLPRISANKSVKSTTETEEHSEDGALDIPGLEATVPSVNVRVRWFYAKTKAGNYAWVLETNTFEMVTGATVEKTRASETLTETRRRDPEEPLEPAEPAVGHAVMLQKICNELGSWDWSLRDRTAKKLDTGWMPYYGTKGIENVRRMKNATQAEVETAIAETAIGESLSVSPAYNEDETMEAVLTRRPEFYDGRIEVGVGIDTEITFPDLKYELYHIELITTRFDYVASDFIRRPAVGAYAVVGSAGGHRTGISSLGGKFLCTWVGGNTVLAGS